MQPREVSEQLEDLFLLDVRESQEWQAGRIEGSVHVPLMQIPARLKELPRNKTIVCVCKVGARSFEAARFLAMQGFAVENLDGGVMSWVRNGLPFTTPAGGPGRLG